jgi:hypothetical protein
MRLSALALLAAVAGGCHTSPPDPCSGQAGACITARIEGHGFTLDQLSVSIEAPISKTVLTPTPPDAHGFGLPVIVGLLLPAAQNTPVNVTVIGLRNGSPLGSDTKQVAFQNNKASVTFTLAMGVLPPDMSIVEMPDMAHPLDQSAGPIKVTSTGPTSGEELRPLALNFVATDPANQAVTLSLSGVPTGASVDGGAASKLVQWNPAFDQAGMYTITATATTPDNRMGMLPVMLTIGNTVDPVFPAPGDTSVPGSPPVPPANFVGDFDGDGKGDLASASVTANIYTVTVLFGDSSGLPTATPIPMMRTKQYTFSFAATTDNPRLQVTGTDVNGDGKSDILVVDPVANAGKGMIYVMLGADRTVAMPPVMQAMDPATIPSTTAENLGTGNVLVGDFNGDGKGDFFATSGPVATKDTIYKFLGKTLPATPPTIFTTPDISDSLAGPFTCTPRRQLMAIGDVDNDMKHDDELLVFDANLGSGGCVAQGGLRIVSNTIAPSPPPYLRPTTTQRGWGGNTAPSMLCDVDGDGDADLVVADGLPSGFAWIWFSNNGAYATASGALDATASVKVAAPANHVYSLVKCVKNFLPSIPATALVADQGDQVSIPARVDLLSSSKTPTVLRSLIPPVPDINFGSALGGVGDVNGDGKGDVMVGAVSVGTMAGKFWVEYGK